MLELNLSSRHDVQPRPVMPRQLASSLAWSEAEVMEAQRLRYKVFAEEMGATPASRKEGIDRDIFDKYCEHLLLRESGQNRVVGTLRILSPEQAQKIGGYHAQTGFDLTRLLPLADRMAEIARPCIHWDYRDGATVTQLWSSLVQHMQQHDHDYLLGCFSLSIADGGHRAASIYRKLHRIYAAPVEYSVFPRCPLPQDNLDQYLDAPIPPLLKGFLRVGAYICGQPGWDQEYNTADLLLLLPRSRLSSNYVRHFPAL